MNSLELVRTFLKDRLGVEPDKVTEQAPLAELGVDSMMLLELMFEFENHLGFRLPSDLQTPVTVGEMVAMMEGLAAKGRA